MVRIISNPTSSVDMQLQELENWCYKQFSIRHYNKNFLKKFYLRSNRNMTTCKEKLGQYFINKKRYPEYLQAGDMSDPNFRHFCQSVYSLYLPELTREGYRIYLDKITDDEKLFDISMIMKYFNMQTDLRYLLDPFDNGEIILFDCNNVNLLTFIAFVPYFMKTLNLVLQVYPMKLKLLVLVNSSVIVEIMINMIKLMLPAKHQQLFYVYSGGTENFLKHVEKSVLPCDCGGELRNLDKLREEWINMLDSQHSWFKRTTLEINMVDLHRLDSSIYGINGTFKNLQID